LFSSSSVSIPFRGDGLPHSSTDRCLSVITISKTYKVSAIPFGPFEEKNFPFRSTSLACFHHSNDQDKNKRMQKTIDYEQQREYKEDLGDIYYSTAANIWPWEFY
jgi:hypothetical protein